MIKKAEYIKGLTHLRDEPDQKPSILLLGRSNVGKSSFINALTNRKDLARTSQNPGKTITFNYYLMNDCFYLVDAPGYGYAKRSKEMQKKFIDMINHFLEESTTLKIICLLIDFKVGPTALDLETYEVLRRLDQKVVLVATKRDKIPSTKQFKQEKEILKALGNPNHFFSVSNVTKQNIDTLANFIVKGMEENE